MSTCQASLDVLPSIVFTGTDTFFLIPKLSLRKISLLVFFLHLWSSLFFSQKLHFLLRLISPELLLNYSTDLHNYFYSLSSVFCILLYLRLKFCAVTPWEARASYSTTALLVSNHCKSHNENCILTSAPALKENHCNIFLAICKQGSYFRVSNNRTYVGLNQKESSHLHVEHSNWYLPSIQQHQIVLLCKPYEIEFSIVYV